MKKLQSKVWYPYAAAICIGVILYVVLNRMPPIAEHLNFLG